MQLASEKKKLRCSLHQLPKDGEKQPHLGKPLGSLLRQQNSPVTCPGTDPPQTQGHALTLQGGTDGPVFPTLRQSVQI